MKRALRAALVAGLVTLVILTTAPAAPACSRAANPTLHEVLRNETLVKSPTTGVFEIEHIAYAPNFFLRVERSVSVVTRYWGEPPPNLDRVTHGRQWLGGYGQTCSNGHGRLGSVWYSWTHGEWDERASIWGIAFSRDAAQKTLTAQQETLLEAAFGPAVVVDHSAVTHITAWANIWWSPILLGLALGAFVVYPLRRHFLSHARTARDRLNWLPLAVGTAFAATIPAMGALHENISIDLNPVGALVVLAATGAGVALSPPIAGTLVVGKGVWLIGEIIGNFGDSPFQEFRFSADRLHHGVWLIVLGLGLLAFSGRHWVRWPGTLALLFGAGSVSSALWPLSGHPSWWLIVPTTLTALGLATWLAWSIAEVPSHQLDDAAPSEDVGVF